MTTDPTPNGLDAPDLPALARRARWEVIKTVTAAKAGHIGGPLSMMDLLVSLYFDEFRIRPRSRIGPTGTGSSCPRAMRRSACTRCWRCGVSCP